MIRLPHLVPLSRRRHLGAVIALAFIGMPLVGDETDEAFKTPLIANLEGVATKIVALAEATDADKFSWRPTPEVRSVSQVYMHIVGTNLQLPALLGASPPQGFDIPDSGPYALGQQRAQWEADYVAKEAVVEILRQSFDYAIAALPEIEDLDTEVTPFGFKASKRDYLLLLMAHAHEHLGQSIAYARSAGVVPPWSRTAPASTEGQRASLPSTAVFEGGWARGETVRIDRFGNLQTSFVGDDLDRLGLQTGDFLTLRSGATSVEVLLGESFFDVQMGEWVGFLSQAGHLLIGRSYANASTTLDLTPGDELSIQAAGSTH